MGRCFHTTTVKAPIEEVWSLVSDFHDLGWAAGVAESCEKVGDLGPNEVGAKRLVNGALHETLATFDAASHSFTYTIDDGPPPLNAAAVTAYTGGVRLTPITIGGGTFIEWASFFGTEDDVAVAEFCNPIYLALLECLRGRFGA